MAKIVVQNDTNPDIGIVLNRTGDVISRRRWAGECTQCGYVVDDCEIEYAAANARAHVDSHDGEE
jgi:hypothetical protein